LRAGLLGSERERELLLVSVGLPKERRSAGEERLMHVDLALEGHP
jgi:hypothetical protein